MPPEAVLASHGRSTLGRRAGVAVVLAVQDTTSLDATGHPATTGLGVLNCLQHQGFLVHTTLAITPERVPLGVLAQQVWTREASSLGQAQTRRQRPIAEQESQKCLTRLAAVKEWQALCCIIQPTATPPQPRHPPCAKRSAGSPARRALARAADGEPRVRSPCRARASSASPIIPLCTASCGLSHTPMRNVGKG